MSEEYHGVALGRAHVPATHKQPHTARKQFPNLKCKRGKGVSFIKRDRERERERCGVSARGREEVQALVSREPQKGNQTHFQGSIRVPRLCSGMKIAFLQVLFYTWLSVSANLREYQCSGAARARPGRARVRQRLCAAADVAAVRPTTGCSGIPRVRCRGQAFIVRSLVPPTCEVIEG